MDVFAYAYHAPGLENTRPSKLKRHLAAFVVRQNKPVVQLDLGPVAPIYAAVEGWRGTFRNANREKADPATLLRQLIWEPLESHLEDAKVVLISPDGVLARFPFVALPGKEPGSYLIEERAIAVVPVPQLLPEMLDPRGEGTNGKDALVAGGRRSRFRRDNRHWRNGAVADARSAPRGEKSGVLEKWDALPNTRAEDGMRSRTHSSGASVRQP